MGNFRKKIQPTTTNKQPCLVEMISARWRREPRCPDGGTTCLRTEAAAPYQCNPNLHLTCRAEAYLLSSSFCPSCFSSSLFPCSHGDALGWSSSQWKGCIPRLRSGVDGTQQSAEECSHDFSTLSPDFGFQNQTPIQR